MVRPAQLAPVSDTHLIMHASNHARAVEDSA